MLTPVYANALPNLSGIVAGFKNTIEAPYASVLGGEGNDASGKGAVVSGGR